ncbi:MAG: molybdopterin-dependent oxidoreductase [Chloroflexi bacterium]|nr:molybdopterin-dependent oxidoreductase [Chloroflexota bacterium]
MARELSRRNFLKLSGASAAAIGAAIMAEQYGFLAPSTAIDNPLAFYPNRDWETIYRDQHRIDRSFSFVCAPNDTHNCRLTATVRNGVITRIEQPYDIATYEDLDGNHATANWNPRGCLKGLAYSRRVYSPSRIKHPVVRAGWKQWVEDGFPRRDDGTADRKYFKRGEDDWVQMGWDELTALVAEGIENIATSYSGEQGAQWLRDQGYPEEMLDTLKDPDGDYAGIRTIKMRGGMAFLGATRLVAAYRFGNMLALLDDHIRGKGPDKSMGSRCFDNYAWHTDLPPGHPMVHGVQTFDQEFNDFWNSDLIVMTGLNLVSNKMADPIWWQSLIERDGKIVVISPEYSASAPKSNYWIQIRQGTDTALNLGTAGLIMREGTYKDDFVKKFTDFPTLVRTDTHKVLRAEDVPSAPLIDPGETWLDEKGAPVQTVPQELKTSPVLMTKAGNPIAASRTGVGENFETGLANNGLSLSDIEMDWSGEVQTKDGPVQARTVFNLYLELTEEYTLENTELITGIPQATIRRLTDDIVAAKSVGFLTGMGSNMYFHNDLINRSQYLVATLTGNVGKLGGNVGSYAGNYKAPVFNGLPSYISEDPFDQTMDPDVDGRDIKKRNTIKFESVHFWDHGDKPLIIETPSDGRVVLTGESHMPSPTKVVWAVNANLLGVAKWHYNQIMNVLPKQELWIAQDYEWNMNCEYADVVFPVDSWVEFSRPDMTASCTNPFVQMFPRGGIKRLHDTRQDIEVFAAVAKALGDRTGDERFARHWQFVEEDNVEVYLQRIIDASSTLRGYNAREMIAADKGFLTLFRTYPRIPGWEQIQESRPFFTRTGRLELYREEDEWISQGENLIVHREPIEATPYQPRVIVAPPDMAAVNPKDYGIPPEDTSDAKTLFNRVSTTSEMLATTNPLLAKGLKFTLSTPKPRHRTHSSWSTSDWNAIWSSNFGDPYRRDTRSPWVAEEEIDINPDDAKELGVNDGDYVWVDANPDDRPFEGHQNHPEMVEITRLMLRTHYNPSLPRGMTMIIHGGNAATHRSVKAQKENADGSAVTDTGYIATFRHGSQQSTVRSWLQPLQMTESLAHKDFFTGKILKGYTVDTHTPTGAPKEVMVKITLAEPGGRGGVGTWAPATSGFTPGNENEDMKRFLAGGFIGS